MNWFIRGACVILSSLHGPSRTPRIPAWYSDRSPTRDVAQFMALNFPRFCGHLNELRKDSKGEVTHAKDGTAEVQ